MELSSKESPILKKPNSALVMVPKIGKLTAVARKMYNVVLHQTQMQINAFKNAGTHMEATHLFSAPLSALLNPITDGVSDPRTVAKQYLLEMRRTEVNWEAPDASSGVIWSSMGLLSQVRLEIKGGCTWVYWALPPSLLLAVSDPDFYTPLNHIYYGRLKSYASIALYEICSRYKNNPSGVTSKNSVNWWSDALSNVPPKLDPITKEPKYREWRKFKNEHVLSAIDEINGKTDLLVELQEFKESRAVVAVQFSVEKKKVDIEKNTDQERISLSAAVVEQALNLDVPLKDVMKEVAAGRNEQDIRLALAQLDARIKRTDLDPVKSRSSYFRGLINTAADQPVQLMPVVHTPVKSIQLVQSTSIQVTQATELSWRKRRRKELADELLQLPAQDQAVYVDEARDALNRAGILTANLAQKLKQGDWRTGLLLSKVFEIYALKNYGAEWHLEPKS